MEQEEENKLLIPAKSKRQIPYGYIVVAVTFVILMVVFGMQNTFGVFFKPMLNDFGWTRAETSGPYSLYLIWYGIGSLVSGRLSDRFGPRLVVSICGLCMGLGYILISRISSLWELYLYYGILAATGTSSYVPLVSTLTRSFTSKRGLMNGISISGIGIGVAILPPIATGLINSHSWRTSFLMFGIIIIITIVAVSQLLKSGTGNKAENKSTILRSDDFSLREVVHSLPFWIICVAWFASGFTFQTAIVHIVPHMTDLGYSDIAAASILAIFGLVGIPGRLGVGLLSDRIGNKKMLIFSFVFIAVAFGVLLFARDLGLFYLFGVIFGLFSAIGIMTSPVVAEYFGLKALGMITGLVVFFFSIGGAIGPTLSGYIYDTYSSYFIAFLLCLIISILATISLLFLKRGSRASSTQLNINSSR